MNDNERLPRFLLIIPDWDLLRFLIQSTISAGMGIHQMITDILSWIVTNLARAIQSKKDSLLHRRQGAVIEGEPKIVWVKMLNRHAEYNCILTFRTRFNNILEQLLANRKHHLIMSVEMEDTNYFAPCNLLNAEGKTKFWRDIDQQIEKYE